MKIRFKSQDGVGLIEILVTVLLLATGLLVMAALQIRSLQFNQGAYMRSQANIYAYDILDRMRLNKKNVTSYKITLEDSKPSGSSLAEVDMREWRTNLENSLPEGKGSITCNISAICTISIQWSELNQSKEESEDKSTFTFSTRL